MKDLNARKIPLQINNPYATEDAAISGMRVAPTTAAGQSSSPTSTTPFSHQVSHGSSAATAELPLPKRPAPSPPVQEQRTEFSKKMKELEQLESNGGTHSGTAQTSIGPRVSQISGMILNNSITEFFSVVKTFRWSHRSQKTKRKFKRRNQRYTAKWSTGATNSVC